MSADCKTFPHLLYQLRIKPYSQETACTTIDANNIQTVKQDCFTSAPPNSNLRMAQVASTNPKHDMVVFLDFDLHDMLIPPKWL